MKRSKLLKVSSAGMLAALAIAGTACGSSGSAGTSPGQSENSSVGTSSSESGSIGGTDQDSGSDTGSLSTEPGTSSSESSY